MFKMPAYDPFRNHGYGFWHRDGIGLSVRLMSVASEGGNVARYELPQRP
jgi:hypothetical protein